MADMTLSEKARTGANPQRGLCGICPAGCWVEIFFDEQGRIAQVRADSQSDLGMICKLGIFPGPAAPSSQEKGPERKLRF